MTTPVTFPIAKLLKEKEFDEPCRAAIVSMSEPFYGRGIKTNSELSKEGLPTLCSAPTIAEVVMWLYEKHGIWIHVEYMDDVLLFGFSVCTIKTNTIEIEEWKFNSPTEAYEAAIEYTLNNLI